jgi:hypothetical protein
MILRGKESPELSKARAEIAELLATLTCEHHREKTPDPNGWAPRTVVYPAEIAGIKEVLKAGRSNILLYVAAGQETSLCSAQLRRDSTA